MPQQTTAGNHTPPVQTPPQPHAYRRDAAEVADLLDVAPAAGLTTADAERRTAAWGANELAEPARRPQWLRLLDQFRSWLIGILLAAAVVAGIIGEIKDALVITVVLLINATIGYLQERRAERSLEALRQMLVPTARVRRDGQVKVIPAGALVPGDVALLEAGDRVPADGRLVVAESVEAAEAALTGESQPVAKTTAPTTADGDEPVPVAERTCMLFMNTALTRGRAEMIVTATGMRTEVGAIAEALRTSAEPPSPLQVQMDSLGRRLALVSGIAVAAYALVSLLRGEELADLALRAVALAVAAIPEGLPAVLALTLALGVHRMARRGAIVKRLASVEALGSATVVCSDKTGTLTLNEMTTRALWAAGRAYEVTGEGYDTAGTVRPADGRHGRDPHDATLHDVGTHDAPTQDAVLSALHDAVLPRGNTTAVVEWIKGGGTAYLLDDDDLSGVVGFGLDGGWPATLVSCGRGRGERREQEVLTFDELEDGTRDSRRRARPTSTRATNFGQANHVTAQAGVVDLDSYPRARNCTARITVNAHRQDPMRHTGDPTDIAEAARLPMPSGRSLHHRRSA